MAAGYVANGIGHGKHGETECQTNTQKPDTENRKCRSEHGASAASEDQPERAETLGERPFLQRHRTSLGRISDPLRLMAAPGERRKKGLSSGQRTAVRRASLAGRKCVP